MRARAWARGSGQGLAPGRGPRHICGAMLAPAAIASPIAVDRLVKRYKSVTAIDGIFMSRRAIARPSDGQILNAAIAPQAPMRYVASKT